MYSLIILAGGIGERSGCSVPKQFAELGGVPMIVHTLRRAELMDEVDEVVVSCHRKYKDEVRGYISQYNLKKPYKIIDGGSTRQESTYFGLMAAGQDDVLIHEAARPFARLSDFRRLMDSPARNAILGAPIPFSVVEGDGEIEGLLDRSRLINVQLPQKFDRNALLAAHTAAREQEKVFTEDAGVLFWHDGTKIAVVPGSDVDIKLTTAADMCFAKAIIDSVEL